MAWEIGSGILAMGAWFFNHQELTAVRHGGGNETGRN